MTTYTQKIPTFETNTWDGTNTTAFKAWVEPFLPDSQGFDWVWDLIDNVNDPENVIEDGILRGRVLEISYGPWNLLFVKNEVALAGPLYDGASNPYSGTAVSSQPAAFITAMYNEVVPPAVQEVDPKAVVAVRKA